MHPGKCRRVRAAAFLPPSPPAQFAYNFTFHAFIMSKCIHLNLSRLLPLPPSPETGALLAFAGQVQLTPTKDGGCWQSPLFIDRRLIVGEQWDAQLCARLNVPGRLLLSSVLKLRCAVDEDDLQEWHQITASMRSQDARLNRWLFYISWRCFSTSR